MTNERVKTLLATKLDHFLSTEIFLWTKTGNIYRKEHKPATISNFQRGIFQNEKKRRTVIRRETTRIDFQPASSLAVYMFEWFSQQPTLTFLYLYFAMRKLKIIFHAGSAETISWMSANCGCWGFWEIPLQIVLEALFMFNMIYVHWIFVFKLVVACSFLVARVIKNAWRKPSEFTWPEVVLIENKQASPECAI